MNLAYIFNGVAYKAACRDAFLGAKQGDPALRHCFHKRPCPVIALRDPLDKDTVHAVLISLCCVIQISLVLISEICIVRYLHGLHQKTVTAVFARSDLPEDRLVQRCKQNQRIRRLCGIVEVFPVICRLIYVCGCRRRKDVKLRCRTRRKRILRDLCGGHVRTTVKCPLRVVSGFYGDLAHLRACARRGGEKSRPRLFRGDEHGIPVCFYSEHFGIRHGPGDRVVRFRSLRIHAAVNRHDVPHVQRPGLMGKDDVEIILRCGNGDNTDQRFFTDRHTDKRHPFRNAADQTVLYRSDLRVACRPGACLAVPDGELPAFTDVQSNIFLRQIRPDLQFRGFGSRRSAAAAGNQAGQTETADGRQKKRKK